jgi:hypothetical protein
VIKQGEDGGLCGISSIWWREFFFCMLYAMLNKLCVIVCKLYLNNVRTLRSLILFFYQYHPLQPYLEHISFTQWYYLDVMLIVNILFCFVLCCFVLFANCFACRCNDRMDEFVFIFSLFFPCVFVSVLFIIIRIAINLTYVVCVYITYTVHASVFLWP